MGKINDSYNERIIRQAMFFVKQVPDLDEKSFRAMLRKKTGRGFTFDYDALYKEYLETWKKDDIT